MDVLFCLNMLLSFFIIKASQVLCRTRSTTPRVLAGSIMGGAFSLTVFLPVLPVFANLVLRLLFLSCVTAVVFGFESVKSFLRGLAALAGISLLLAGLVLGVWLLFEPQGLIIKNGTIYLDIGFVALVVFAAAAYSVVWLVGRLRKNSNENSQCTVELEYSGETIELKGVIDTGNMLFDSFTGKKISVIDRCAALRLLEAEEMKKICEGSLPEGMHYTITNTVGGEKLLPVFTAEKLKVKNKDEYIEVDKPSLAIAATDSFAKDVSILINAQFLPIQKDKRGEMKNDKKAYKQNKRNLTEKKEECFLHKRLTDSATSADNGAGRRDYAKNRAGRR